MQLNKIVKQENHNLLTVGSSNSTSVSMKHNGTTSTSTFLQCLFIQYLHKVVITILCLQPFLLISVHEDTLHHLYKDIYTVIHLLSSLLTSLRSEIPRPSLLTSLRSKLLQVYLLVFLRNGIIRSSLLVSLQSGTKRSYALASLRSKFLLASPLTSLWKIFLQRLYEDIPTVTPIPSKPQTFLQ